MRRFLVAQRGLERVGLRVWRETKMLFDELPNLLDERIESSAFFVHDRRASDERHERPVSILDADRGRPFAAFHHHLDLAVFLFLRLKDSPQRSNSVDLFGIGLVYGGVVLSG